MIGERLKELRLKKGLTKKQVAEQLNIKEKSYIAYEYNSRDVSTAQLEMFASFYNVTADYLLGREPKPLDPISDLCNSLGLNLHERAIVTAYLAMSEDGRTELAKLIHELAHKSEEVQQKENQKAETDYITVSTTLGELEDQMKADEDANSKDGA